MTSFWVPGRIEVLGKHTDYAGGRSLLCAVERGFTVSAERRADNAVWVTDDGRRETFSTALAPDASAPAGSWGSYVATVARRLARDFPAARTGADITLRSDLPPDAGLSSSAALVVAIALALLDANDLESSAEFASAIASQDDLAGYLGTVENGLPFGAFAGDAGVGTFGGSEDHTAILCCRTGELSQYSFAPVTHEGNVVLDPSLTFVIGVSGVVANKTGGALAQYNRLSVATAKLLEIWNREQKRADPTLARAMESEPHAAERLRSFVDAADCGEFSAPELRGRLDQFIEESETLVRAATNAFRSRNTAELGKIVDRSQQLAEAHLGNQIDETISLQRLAREHGAFAASAFGAGFGGSVWALVRASDAEAFSSAWAADYRKRHPQAGAASQFFTTRPGGPARKV